MLDRRLSTHYVLAYQCGCGLTTRRISADLAAFYRAVGTTLPPVRCEICAQLWEEISLETDRPLASNVEFRYADGMPVAMGEPTALRIGPVLDSSRTEEATCRSKPTGSPPTG